MGLRRQAIFTCDFCGETRVVEEKGQLPLNMVTYRTLPSENWQWVAREVQPGKVKKWMLVCPKHEVTVRDL